MVTADLAAAAPQNSKLKTLLEQPPVVGSAQHIGANDLERDQPIGQKAVVEVAQAKAAAAQLAVVGPAVGVRVRVVILAGLERDALLQKKLGVVAGVGLVRKEQHHRVEVE